MMINSTNMVAKYFNNTWMLIVFAIFYLPFVLSTPSQLYNLLIPDELWYTLRIIMQAAWLAPSAIVWKDVRENWSGKYFLSGFLVGGSWLIVVQLVATTIQTSNSLSLSLVKVSAFIGSSLFIGITSGLYSLKAKSISQALAFGFLCFVGQVTIFFLVFLRYLFIVVD